MQNEIKEIYHGWSKLSPLFKLLSLIGLFLSLSSITSISDVIVEWRGLIKNIIMFWHQMTKPIISLFDSFGLDIKQYQIDSFTIISLYQRINFSTIQHFREGNFFDTLKLFLPNFGQTIISKITGTIKLIIFIAFFFPIIIFIYPKSIYFYAVIMSISLLSILPLIFREAKPSSIKLEFGNKEKAVAVHWTQKEARLFVSKIALIILLVILLYLIQEGFTREI